MAPLRELIKRSVPDAARKILIGARERLAAPPYEEIVLHDYDPFAEAETRPRLTLVINSIAPSKAFGGVATGLDIFLEIGQRTGADLRVVLDDFERRFDRSVIDRRLTSFGLDPGQVEVVPRTSTTPRLGLRMNETFVSYTCWISLNVRHLVKHQARLFDLPKRRPYIYIVQDYEPQFYPFSSTHMRSRSAFSAEVPYWAIFNSQQLYSYVLDQGHRADRSFVFEPRISDSLRPFLNGSPLGKRKRILVYGRPNVPRNCFPAARAGLRLWAERHGEFADWEVVSAGTPHKPMAIAPGRVMRSLGKLTIEEYAELLRTTAVGLSLMASPHPSYPPLEMAHFGILAVTNRYACKDLGTAHGNIVSIDDIDPGSIAAALATACRRFEAEPDAGWQAPSHSPAFLAGGAFPFIDEIARELVANEWRAS